MGKSLEELRSSLRKIREDLAQLPELPRKNTPSEPAARPPEPRRAEALPSISEREDVVEVDEALLEKPEPPMRSLHRHNTPARAPARHPLMRRLPEAISLAVASAGAFAGSRLLLGAGLFAVLAALLVGSQASEETISQPAEDLARRLDDLERRLSDRAFSASAGGGVSPELEEQIREMRRILFSFMNTLEQPEAAQRTEETQ